MLSAAANIWRSRLFKLTVSVLMLTMSVLLFADFFKIRGDVDQSLREARKSMAESLAVQLTVFAGAANTRGVKDTVDAFVGRSADVEAVVLAAQDGSHIAAQGKLALVSDSLESSNSLMIVPIFSDGLQWGEVRVAFKDAALWPKQLAYFGFVGGACFILYLLFLRKALNQIDPSRVVPGRVNHAFNLLSEGVVILDKNLQVMLANDAMGELLGRPASELMGQNIDDWPWHRGEEWVAPWLAAIEGGSFTSDDPLELVTSERSKRLLVVNCAVVGAEENKTKGLLVTFDDMTTIEEKNRELHDALRLLKRTQVSIQNKNKELEALATQDPLTGVANRRALLARLADDFIKANREKRPLSVIMVDIDFFKKINDTFGHVVGDDVIRVVAKVLSSQSREYDLVGRYGGEEFLVVLPDLDAAQAREIAERMRLKISEAAESDKLPLQALTASLGIADLHSLPDTYMDLIDNADQALYAAKQGGRDRTFMFDPKIRKLKAEDGASQPVETSISSSNSH